MKHGTAFPRITKRTHLPSLPRRASLLFAGSLLVCLSLVEIPLSVQAVHPTPSVQSSYQSQIQGTPTVDPTVTALEKEKLEHETDWWWTNGVTLLTSLVSTVALLGGGLFAFVRWRREQEETEIHRREDRKTERDKREEEQKRWFEDRQAEREKRTEERFQSVVEGLGSTVQATQVGAAITLRTFLRPGYEEFYSQVFDLAVAHLRLRPLNPDEADPLDSLSQALITIFAESFPLARNHQPQAIRQLDAAHIHLDNAYLAEADLRQIWLPQTSLRQANLWGADLSKATLSKADLREAQLSEADLSEADLSKANLRGANLRGANLRGANLIGAQLREAQLREATLSGAGLIGTNLREADLREATLIGTNLRGADLSGAGLSSADLREANLSEANLSRAHLSKADLSEANLWGANLSEATLSGAALREANLWGADLSGADLSGATLSGAQLSRVDLSKADLSGADLSGADLSGADLSRVKSLTKTNLQRTTGLTQEALETCKAKGAIM